MTFIYILLACCFGCIILLLGILYRIVSENEKWKNIEKDNKPYQNEDDFINFQ